MRMRSQAGPSKLRKSGSVMQLSKARSRPKARARIASSACKARSDDGLSDVPKRAEVDLESDPREIHPRALLRFGVVEERRETDL